MLVNMRVLHVVVQQFTLLYLDRFGNIFRQVGNAPLDVPYENFI